MNYMSFADGTKIEIDEGASLDRIVNHSQNEAAALFVCEKCTPENVSHIVFSQPGDEGDVITGEYDNLMLTGAPTRQTNEDLTVTVTISLREKNELELRVEALEESQGVQDEAIDDLGGAVSDMMEG